MSLIWKTETGSLYLTQVSTADVVNTYSAARAVYGWMGGLDGAQFLLTRIPNPFVRRIRELHLDQNLRLMPFQGHVLMAEGPLVAHIDNARDSFGGDIRTQVLGTTLCALAHECEALTAARLFCRFLMPYLFGEPSPITDALQAQVMENANLQKILNEGSSRGLNNLFIDTLARLNLPVANQGWRQTKVGQQDLEYDFLGEVNMVGGLLRWIAQDKPQEYRTRSGCVARVAACLMTVGYNIGTIQTWTGQEDSPYPKDRKSLTLVLGGSSNTDPLMEYFVQLPDTPLILHYQFRTTGAMLLMALGDAPAIPPEVLQEDFEQIFKYTEAHLTINFTDGEDGPHAICHWKKADRAPTPIAIRLASILFPDASESIAPCYSRIANQSYLDGLRGRSRDIVRPRKKELARFRAISACVIISIMSRFAPSTFHLVHHVTTMDLGTPDWLEKMASKVDTGLSSENKYIYMGMVVPLLAKIHAGDKIEDNASMHVVDTHIIALRKGIFGILPSFLLNMKLHRDKLEYVCIDYFWANVKVSETGYIKSASTPDIRRYDTEIEHPTTDTNLSSLQRLDQLHPGLPDNSLPDQSLYLSLGSPLHNGEPDLCFIAWISGSAAGTVGISDVQRAILLSRVEPETCPGHDAHAPVVNVKASLWGQDPYSKPTNRDYPIFVPVKGDDCWAMFVAGQTVLQNGRIVFRCVDCAMEHYVNATKISSGSVGPRLFVGFE